MDLRVASKNERINFERLIKQDSMQNRNKIQAVRSNLKQLDSNNNENFNSNPNKLDNKSNNLIKYQQNTKTKRDQFWEEKRNKKEQDTRGNIPLSNNQIPRGRGNDILSKNPNDNNDKYNNRRGNSVPYYSENNSNYNKQREVFQTEKMNTTDYSKNSNNKFQYEGNKFNSTSNLPGNQQLYEAKSNEIKINHNRPNFSGIKLYNDMPSNNNNNYVLQNNHNYTKNKFNPQFSKY